MACNEHMSLQQEYEAALRECQLHQVLLWDGSLKADGHRRQRLFSARRLASVKLYNHALTCPKCKLPTASESEQMLLLTGR